MQRYNAPQITRPLSMAQNRLDWKYKTAQPRLQSSYKQQINSKEQKLNYQLNNPQLPSNFIYISVTKQKEKNIANTLQQQQRKKLNTFSRENIQNMNKKYRQIRSSRINSYVGLYDLQNDRRLFQSRAISAFNGQGENLLSKEIKNLKIKPQKIQQLQGKKVNKIRKRGKSQPQHRQTQIDQQILKSNRNRQRIRPVKQTKNKKVVHKRSESADIFMPEKQSQTGYMCNKFQSKLKKKSMQDNLHVMATLIRKKIKILDQKDMVIYLKKLTSTNNT